jgi:hypothetical protein
MPTPYIFGQTPLENYAINGNSTYWGPTGRLWLMQQTKVGTGKAYQGPYKNPTITGNKGDEYSVVHTNSVSDNKKPSYGKGTGNQIDVNDTYNGVTARNNYNGGSFEDRKGVASQIGSGREGAFTKNVGLWGYAPKTYGKEYNKQPDMAKNIGQVDIK